MRIKNILISLRIREKIFKKHNVREEEIEGVFFDEPYFFHTREKRYIAIGFLEKYITVVFDYDGRNAIIVTAYESSEWQKKLYRVKRWKK